MDFLRPRGTPLTSDHYNGLQILSRLGLRPGDPVCGIVALRENPRDTDQLDADVLFAGGEFVRDLPLRHESETTSGPPALLVNPHRDSDTLPGSFTGQLIKESRARWSRLDAPVLTTQPLLFLHPWLQERIIHRLEEVEHLDLEDRVGAGVRLDLRWFAAELQKSGDAFVPFSWLKRCWLELYCDLQPKLTRQIEASAEQTDCRGFIELERLAALALWNVDENKDKKDGKVVTFFQSVPNRYRHHPQLAVVGSYEQNKPVPLLRYYP